MNKRIRVVIADDHPLMRKGLQMTFDAVAEDFTLVGEAADGASALHLVEELQPDVVLMDIRMPGMNGLEALEHIRSAWPQIAVVMLTTFNDDELVLRGLQAGACGYLLKDCDLDTLLDAIRTAARGDTLLQSGMITRLLQALPPATPSMPPPRSSGPFELTEREREILAGVVGRLFGSLCIATSDSGGMETGPFAIGQASISRLRQSSHRILIHRYDR